MKTSKHKTSTSIKELRTWWNLKTEPVKEQLIQEYTKELSTDSLDMLLIQDIETIYIYEVLSPRWWDTIADGYKDLSTPSPILALLRKYNNPDIYIRVSHIHKVLRGNIYIAEILELRKVLLQTYRSKIYFRLVDDPEHTAIFSSDEVSTEYQGDASPRLTVKKHLPIKGMKYIDLEVVIATDQEAINEYIEGLIQSDIARHTKYLITNTKFPEDAKDNESTKAKALPQTKDKQNIHIHYILVLVYIYLILSIINLITELYYTLII